MSTALAEREVMTEQLVDAQPVVELSIVKITNPLWVGGLASVIQDFCGKIKVPSISYGTLYSYFCNTVQFGGERAEFWVALNGKEPVAFAHWYAKGLPHSGIVSCDFIHSWNRMSEPISMLIDKYIEFGIKNNAPLYEGDAINEVIFRVFRKAAFKKGLNLTKTELVNFVGRKR
jgi:hypothetical protein